MSLRQQKSSRGTINNDGLPKFGSQRMNQYLMELGKLAQLCEQVCVIRYKGAKRIEILGPTWQHLTSHVARHTCVAIALEAGMRPEVVRSNTTRFDTGSLGVN